MEINFKISIDDKIVKAFKIVFGKKKIWMSGVMSIFVFSAFIVIANVPYTFVNNQAADADQINDNFTNLVNQDTTHAAGIASNKSRLDNFSWANIKANTIPTQAKDWPAWSNVTSKPEIPTKKTYNIEFCSCTGYGGLTGITTWGPKGEDCYGLSAWGKYDKSCRKFSIVGVN